MQYKITKKHAAITLDFLEARYPEARCALVYKNPWELLVATILSAQCTDVRVNKVTPKLFKMFPGPHSFAKAHPTDIENVIRSTGFYRNKSRHLILCAKLLVKDHNGNVPGTIKDLVTLPGVGRKTANVVLGNAFGVPGMVVDTHVGRISRRLGWTKNTSAEKVERDLCGLLPAQRWTQASHVLIFHGRQCCRAQTAWCSNCPVQERCPQKGVLKAK
jgi:endonuclease-3